MSRENAQAKGRRMLVEGRLRVLRVESDLIVAECRGDSGEVYRLGFDPLVEKQWGWFCECPAKGTCSHLVALRLVVTAPRVRLREPRPR